MESPFLNILDSKWPKRKKNTLNYYYLQELKLGVEFLGVQGWPGPHSESHKDQASKVIIIIIVLFLKNY